MFIRLFYQVYKLIMYIEHVSTKQQQFHRRTVLKIADWLIWLCQLATAHYFNEYKSREAL